MAPATGAQRNSKYNSKQVLCKCQVCLDGTDGQGLLVPRYTFDRHMRAQQTITRDPRYIAQPFGRPRTPPTAATTATTITTAATSTATTTITTAAAATYAAPVPPAAAAAAAAPTAATDQQEHGPFDDHDAPIYDGPGMDWEGGGGAGSSGSEDGMDVDGAGELQPGAY